MDPDFQPQKAFHARFFEMAGDPQAVSEWITPVWDASFSLMLAAILIALWLLRSRTLPLLVAGAAMVLGLVLNAVRDEVFPPDLIAAVLRGMFPRLAVANIDTFVVITLMTVTALLALTLVLRRTRSRDRLVWTIVNGSLIATTFQFHLLFISGGMMTAFLNEGEQLKQASFLTERAFFEYCGVMQIDCAQVPLPATFEEKRTAFAALFPELKRVPAERQDEARRRLLTDWDDRMRNAPEGEFAIYNFAVVNPDILSGGPLAVAYTELRANPQGMRLLPGGRPVMRVAVDNRWLLAPYGAQEYIFKFQMAVAHAVWFLGGLLVIGSHRRMIQGRARRAAEARGEAPPPAELPPLGRQLGDLAARVIALGQRAAQRLARARPAPQG